MSESKMSQKITISTNPLDVVGNDEVATIWRDQGVNGSSLIATLSKSPGFEEGQQFGKELVAAYNGTYGIWVNPEAVADLKQALVELLYQFKKVVRPSFTLDNMLIFQSEAAIAKSKLNP